MDGQFGRTVGYTGAGGADLGEAGADSLFAQVLFDWLDPLLKP